MERTSLISSQRPQRGGGGFRSLVPLCSAEERKKLREIQQQMVQHRLLKEIKQKSPAKVKSRPIVYEKPAYNTPMYWRDCACGWITDEEQREDHARYELRRKRALDSKYNRVAPPHRHDRAAPRPTNQFAKPMSTQAARDDRLAPQAKALLQVIVARTGKGRSTDTTKTTLGKIMNRCPRSIQRYLQELIRFGYIRTQTRKSRRTGFFIGLRIWIMNTVLPFYAKENTDYDPQVWVDLVTSRRNPVETEVSLTNNKQLITNAFRQEKPPWFAEYVY